MRRARTQPRGRRPDGQPRKGASSGTGFVINAGGDVLTNAHVAGKCGSISTRIAGRTYSGDLVAKDEANDLAVVRFAGLPVRATARFAGRTMRLGTNVVVFGYPLTAVLGEDLKATTGNVSGTSGVNGNSGFFQFTAPIQPGNSGGPIVDSTGSVAGVVSFKLRELWVASRTGTLPQLLNFGIKSRTVRSFLQTKDIPHSASRATRTLSTVQIASAAEHYTIRIVCR